MPPFKLEGIKSNPNDRRVPKMLFCKKEYNEKVKITDWNLNLECQPIDTNPYNPKCWCLHNSHYDRLGNQDVPRPISETHDSLRNGINKLPAWEHDPHKYLMNFYTFRNYYACEPNTKDPCSKICADYKTTMQTSYEAPSPCIKKGLVMAVDGNQNKHMAGAEECKFLDDNFICFTKTLQDKKGFRHISFNPCTGMNTDGSKIRYRSVLRGPPGTY